MHSMILIRGLPGSGKSTKAHQMAEEITNGCTIICEADQYFEQLGHFDGSKLGRAHEECKRKALNSLHSQYNIIVSNTFSKQWEMQPYINMANEFGVTVDIIDLFDGGLTDAQLAERCVHKVPQSTINKMRNRWEK